MQEKAKEEKNQVAGDDQVLGIPAGTYWGADHRHPAVQVDHCLYPFTPRPCLNTTSCKASHHCCLANIVASR